MSRDPPLVDFTSGGILDGAETFAESDLTLTRAGTVVASESIALDEESGSSTATCPADDGSAARNEGGLKFQTGNSLVTQVEATISPNSSGYTTAKILDADGVELDQQDISGIGAGGTVTFSGLSLDYHTYYYITMDAGGSDFDMGWNLNDVSTGSFPFGSLYGDITAAYVEGSDQVSKVVAWSDLTFTVEPASEGQVLVEWPDPPDVYRWDAALFQRTPDGESVDVYVEEDDGTGFTTIAGPVARGDDVTADPASSVRFRVELSRQNTANTPALDSIHRRYII